MSISLRCSVVISRALIAASLAGLALTLTRFAKADTPAVIPSNSRVLGTDTPGYLLGYYFTPDNDLFVTALGYWDSQDDGNGFNSSHEIGIYDSASGNLLFSTTLSAGTVDPLTAEYRYKSIAPQLLQAGVEYAIVGTAGNDYYFGDQGTPGTNGVTLTSGGQYGYANSLQPTPSVPFSFGSSVPYPNQYSLYGGPNFQVAPVPEPGILAFGATFAGGLRLLARRRAKK